MRLHTERFLTMLSQRRIEQLVAIALLVLLGAGCLPALRPFLSA
jgi:hypothetical protein